MFPHFIFPLELVAIHNYLPKLATKIFSWALNPGNLQEFQAESKQNCQIFCSCYEQTVREIYLAVLLGNEAEITMWEGRR